MPSPLLPSDFATSPAALPSLDSLLSPSLPVPSGFPSELPAFPVLGSNVGVLGAPLPPDEAVDGVPPDDPGEEPEDDDGLDEPGDPEELLG